MEYLLDNNPAQGSPYGCWNAIRAKNGAPVRHGSGVVRYNQTGAATYSEVIANTVWQGSKKGEYIKCMYGQLYAKGDNYCKGCDHGNFE